MKYIFLDTNIYLHFQDFEQIPWNEIVKDDTFALVIPDKVVAEIDKVKDGQPRKIKNRAKNQESLQIICFMKKIIEGLSHNSATELRNRYAERLQLSLVLG